jgi:hypothetical protein
MGKLERKLLTNTVRCTGDDCPRSLGSVFAELGHPFSWRVTSSSSSKESYVGSVEDEKGQESIEEFQRVHSDCGGTEESHSMESILSGGTVEEVLNKRKHSGGREDVKEFVRQTGIIFCCACQDQAGWDRPPVNLTV